MRQQFKIVCRGSRLSLAQADLVIRRIQQFNPLIEVTVVVKETQGDADQTSPLEELEGRDFFTKDIQDFLLTGQADFAVHSLKDVSGENFFKDNQFAIIEREDPHDVAIFNEGVLDKLISGDSLIVGTSSPRRAEMAIHFLASALPNVNSLNTRLLAAPIRGNVDTRLQKLNVHNFDGIILACAGLNRLLRSPLAKDDVRQLLKGKLLMVLPLLDCPPAPGQGAIVAECIRGNSDAREILIAINDQALAKAVEDERKVASQFGSGCHQKFGAIHLKVEGEPFVHASGKDRSDVDFSFNFVNGKIIHLQRKSTSVDSGNLSQINKSIRLIDKSQLSSFKESDVSPSTKRNWVTETDLWYALARRGVWVEGSLEGFGTSFSEPTLNSPLVNIHRDTLQ